MSSCSRIILLFCVIGAILTPSLCKKSKEKKESGKTSCGVQVVAIEQIKYKAVPVEVMDEKPKRKEKPPDPPAPASPYPGMSPMSQGGGYKSNPMDMQPPSSNSAGPYGQIPGTMMNDISLSEFMDMPMSAYDNSSGSRKTGDGMKDIPMDLLNEMMQHFQSQKKSETTTSTTTTPAPQVTHQPNIYIMPMPMAMPPAMRPNPYTTMSQHPMYRMPVQPSFNGLNQMPVLMPPPMPSTYSASPYYGMNQVMNQMMRQVPMPVPMQAPRYPVMQHIPPLTTTTTTTAAPSPPPDPYPSPAPYTNFSSSPMEIDLRDEHDNPVLAEPSAQRPNKGEEVGPDDDDDQTDEEESEDSESSRPVMGVRFRPPVSDRVMLSMPSPMRLTSLPNGNPRPLTFAEMLQKGSSNPVIKRQGLTLSDQRVADRLMSLENALRSHYDLNNRRIRLKPNVSILNNGSPNNMNRPLMGKKALDSLFASLSSRPDL
jgi:hypothetical protein